MRTIIGILAMLVIATLSTAADLGSFSQPQMEAGLKDALSRSASNAVGLLGRQDGFLGNPQVKIPLPKPLSDVESMLRTFGMGKQADELITAMNRAAEEAIPQAKTLLISAVKKMSVQDAKAILTGGDNAATTYFRNATESQLKEKFLPIVTKTTQKVGLAQRYNQLVDKAASTRLMGGQAVKIEDYVTQKALDGLYLTMTEEEKKIRQNPVQAGTDLAQKIFGVLRQ